MRHPDGLFLNGRRGRVVDPELILSDPDPTFQLVSDPDPYPDADPAPDLDPV